MHQVIHHDFVVAFQLAAQGIGQQFLRQVAGKIIGSSGDDGFQFFGARKTLSARQFARRINRLAIAVPVTPAPDGIEVLQTKPDRVEDLVAIGADGIRAVQLGALTQRQVRDCRLVLLVQGRNIRRGRRHMVAEHLFQHPHAALDGAGAVGE